MNKDLIIKSVEQALWAEKEIPAFKSGDTITVTYKISFMNFLSCE